MHQTRNGGDIIRRLTSRRLAICVIAIPLCLSLLAGCVREDPRLTSLKMMEQSGNLTGPERVRELEAVIAEYETVVNGKVQAAVKQADYLKLLAQEYSRQQLHGLALETYEEAIYLEPQNQVLHHLAGVSAGYLGKAQGQEEDRIRYFRIAERHYLQSINLDSSYLDALYGLAILYVFETNEPFKAIPHLETLLSRSQTDVPALFVLARAHFALGNLDAAAAAYDEIIEKAPDRESRERAERNRVLILEGG